MKKSEVEELLRQMGVPIVINQAGLARILKFSQELLGGRLLQDC